MSAATQDARVAALVASGFDRCRVDGARNIIVGCSQCEALVIQGVACHESGCPNERRARRRDIDETE